MKIQELALPSAFLPPYNKDAPTSAWLGHIPFAGWLIEAMRPSVFVELGTHYGDSYFAFCQAVKRNSLPTLCYAVDTWQGDEHAGEYSEVVFTHVRQYHDADFSAFSNLMRMRFDEALAHFSDCTVDLLHIDGLHTYDALKDDFETWLPKLSIRAVVLFHDTNVRQGDFGVWRYWEEVSVRYPHISFDHSHGLGVLFVGAEQPEILKELLAAWSEESGAQSIRDFFATLGQHHTAAWHDRKELSHRATLLTNIQSELARKQEEEQSLRAYAENLQAQVAALDAEAQRLNDAARVAHEHWEEANRRLEESHQRLKAADRSLEEAHQRWEDACRQNADLMKSTSWRITAPLRSVGQVFKR